MSYGRHQSFYLKKHWITKGLNSFNLFGEKTIFKKDSFVLLGLGKNMHQSLRYWLEATNILHLTNKAHKLTEFGKLVSEFDIGCNKDLTKNLLHYYLVNKVEGVEISHTFYWFFNIYQESIFTKEKILNDLILWNSNVTSSNTLSRDIDCLLSLYTREELSHPEDKNVSLLAEMKLIKTENENYIKSPISDTVLSMDTAFYILLLMKELNIHLSLVNILTKEYSLGKAFNLTRTDVIDLIEKMVSSGYPLEITRTNNLDTIKLNSKVSSSDFLNNIYRGIKIW
mgnify:CR=1 FL=1